MLGNNIQEIAKLQKTNSYICKSCHVELQQKLHVCVVTDICRNMYVKCTTKWTMTYKFCCITMLMTCIKFCTWRAIYLFIVWQKIKRNKWWKPSCTILCQVSKCSHRSKLSEGTESKTWICVHMLSLHVIL